MIGYKLFRFSVNADQSFIEEAMATWIKEMGNISIDHVAQDQIGDKLNMSVFYEDLGGWEQNVDPATMKVVYHHPLTEVQTSEQFYTLEKQENELKTKLTKAGIQARIDEINEGGTLLECYAQFKTLLQKVVNSMEDSSKIAILLDHLDTANGVIANASGSNGADVNPNWEAAAEKWRDDWHKILDLTRPEREEDSKIVGPAPESNHLSQTQASKLTKEE